MVMAKLSLQRRNKGFVKKQKRKLAPRAILAIWVGQVARTGEHIVVKANGDAVRCRTVKRVPVGDRWQVERALLIRATPRCPAPSSKDPEKLVTKLADEEAKVINNETERPEIKPLDRPTTPVEARKGDDK